MFKINTIYHRAVLKYFSLILGLLILSCSKKDGNAGNPGNNNTFTFDAAVTVQANDIKQVIEGFGCATVFIPANTSLSASDLDHLFGNSTNEVGLNILRIRLASDNGWRAIELTNAKGAIQRGAKVLATPWSPPANMKTNNNIVGGSLITDSSASYAKYLNDFADYMSANGAPLYAVSIQNEPDITVNYESCNWTADQMRDFLKNYGQLITSTKVLAPESFHNDQNFTNTILNDNTAASHVNIVGGHIYGGGIVENTVAESEGKEVWMTEHLDTNISYAADLNTAVEIHNCLTQANFSAYIWWYGKRFYGPIDDNGNVTKRGYVMSQFARFIAPGSVRLGTGTNSNAAVLISAYKNTAGKITIVAINTSEGIANQKITVSNASVSQVIPYTTAADKNTAPGAMITVANNSFTDSLPPNSITTFVQQ
jgi:glucuronoarabinoxylan endo-1,4-beta-xylanase